LSRFRRAVEIGSLLQAEAAARELGRLELENALSFVLLMRRKGDDRYPRAAIRLVGRILAERPTIGFELAGTLLDGFADLEGTMADVARSRLALALRGADLRRAADYVARSADLG
jgi:hypothetical protein